MFQVVEGGAEDTDMTSADVTLTCDVSSTHAHLTRVCTWAGGARDAARDRQRGARGHDPREPRESPLRFHCSGQIKERIPTISAHFVRNHSGLAAGASRCA
eukprot:1115343-Rhodomonas_salina.1